MFLEIVKNRIINMDNRYDYLAEAKRVALTDARFRSLQGI